VQGVVVYVLAEIGIGRVGCAEVYRIGVGQFAVTALPGACTSENADLEGTTGFVLGYGLFRNLGWCALGHACWGETRKADCLSVLYQCCSLGSGNFLEFHNKLVLFIISAQKYKKIAKSSAFMSNFLIFQGNTPLQKGRERFFHGGGIITVIAKKNVCWLTTDIF
jgi:hypothetical protein